MRIPTAFWRLALLGTVVAVTWLATTPLAVPVAEDINDKLSHVLAFFALALLLDRSVPESRFGFAKMAVLLGYGLLIEVVQYFLPYRTSSMLDLAADGVGIALYMFSLPLIHQLPALRTLLGIKPQ